MSAVADFLPLLEVRALRAARAGREILKGISLTLQRGEIGLIVGPNGAGKSTLLRCLAGVHGYAGSVSSSLDVQGQVSARQWARRVAYMPQLGTELPPFTVRELVLLGRHPHVPRFRDPGAEDIAAVEEALRSTGLDALACRRLDQLSAGELQRAHLASVLAQGADVLLLDEPTSFLDPRHEESMMQILQRVARDEQRTVLMVTHDLNRAVVSADRVFVLDGGTLRFSGPVSEMCDTGVLDSVFRLSFVYGRHGPTGRRFVLPETVM